MDEEQSQLIKDVAQLKGEVRFIVQTLQQVQLDTKQVLNKFSDKIDEMAKYHQEIGGYIKTAADNSKQLDIQNKKIEKIKDEVDERLDTLEKWKIAVVAGGTVILAMYTYGFITIKNLL